MADFVKAMCGLLNFSRALGEGSFEESRRHALTNAVGKQIVDTVCTPDTGRWETGVKRNGEWTTVQQYEDCSAAEAGHKAWITRLTIDPSCELPDVDLWGLKE